MVLNPNENYQEVERLSRSPPLPLPGEPPDEPAEKRERKDDKESKKKREFYEKYRNPQKETETDRIPIRVSPAGTREARVSEESREEVTGERRDRCRAKGDMTWEAGIQAKFERDKRSTSARTMGGG